ncbi:MAG: 2-oxoacid:ferredoxin oxidoreductase subunit beta [Bacillota bacterium]
MAVKDYLRREQLPHIWCAGCGHGIIMGALVRALERSDIDPAKVVAVSGIGCSSRATTYLNVDTLHTTHGRALAFATGVKLARPDLTVIVITGDGDAAAIGGNHLIHSARRNIDITVVCFNNSTYGMTSGQYSPMTPLGHLATTAPYGNLDRPFDLCRLVEAAGATYVARGTAYHATQLEHLIAEGLANPGFSFIEAISQCPTYYGRRNRLGEAVAMLKWQKDNTISVQQAAGKTPAELEGKLVTGRLHQGRGPEYTASYRELVERLQKRGETV